MRNNYLDNTIRVINYIDPSHKEKAIENCAIRVVSEILSVKVVNASDEYHIDIDITSPELYAPNEHQDTATIVVTQEQDAKHVYEALNDAKRRNCLVILSAACAWANDFNGIHLHHCSASIIEKEIPHDTTERR